MREIVTAIQNQIIFAVMSNAVSQKRIESFPREFKKALKISEKETDQIMETLLNSSTLTMFFVGEAQKLMYDMCVDNVDFSASEIKRLNMLTQMLFEGTGVQMSIDGTCIFFCGVRIHDFRSFLTLEDNTPIYARHIAAFFTNEQALCFMSNLAMLSVKLNTMQAELGIQYLLDDYVLSHPNTPYKQIIIDDHKKIYKNIHHELSMIKNHNVYRSFYEICSNGVEGFPHIDESYIDFIDCQIQKTKIILKEMESSHPSKEFAATYNIFIHNLPIDIDSFVANNFESRQ